MSKEINEIAKQIEQKVKVDTCEENDNYSPAKPIAEEQTEEKKSIVSSKKEKLLCSPLHFIMQDLSLNSSRDTGSELIVSPGQLEF